MRPFLLMLLVGMLFGGVVSAQDAAETSEPGERLFFDDFQYENTEDESFVGNGSLRLKCLVCSNFAMNCRKRSSAKCCGAYWWKKSERKGKNAKR